MEQPTTKQCWECRRRRLVCDFARPKCRKCQARGVACPGYDNKPLKWLHPQQVNAKGPERTVVPRTVKPAGDSGMTAVLEAIEYYNVHIAPDLAATGSSGPGSPYWMPQFTAPLLRRSISQSIVCTSLCHRILQSSDVDPMGQVVLARRLQRHRGDALRALTTDLAQAEHQTSDVTLAAVLLLLMIQQSFEPPNWHHHIDGATALIGMKGGLGHLVFSRPYLCHLFRYYALIELMGATTSPRIATDTARNHLELITLIPVLYGNGLSTCFPCPPDLLTEIIRINHLRSLFCGSAVRADTDPDLLRESRSSAALDILRRIRAFSTEKWAADVVVGLSREVSVSQPDLAGWHAIASIYQSAIAIYCIASLLHDECGDSRGLTDPVGAKQMLDNAREVCCRVLISRLREVIECTQLRKLVLWPVVVAGLEAGDEDTKGFVVGELTWTSNALGTAAPLVAKDLLENRVWKLGLGRRSWGGLFDQPYVFVL